VAAQKTESLLILPFDLNAPEEFDHLQGGVLAMLNSQLSLPGEIDVIVQEDGFVTDRVVDVDSALAAARKSGADYVLSGSISLFGSYVSSDALLYDVEQGVKVGSFSRSGSSIEELPEHIGSIADDIRGLIVLGLQPDRPQATMHYQNETASATDNSYFMPSSSAAVEQTLEFPVDTYLNAIAAGDVDGDGQNEICVASLDSLIFYRWEQGRLNQISTMKVSVAATILGLEIVDLNGNGRAEVFVTNFHESRGQLNSYVVEWDGTEFTQVAKGLYWFFGAMANEDGEGKRIVGQQMGRDSLYSRNGLFEMVWDGEQYAASKRIDLPEGVDIHGFAVGDFLQSGNRQYAQITQKQNLTLVAADSSILWQGREDDYGGNKRSISIDPEYIGVSLPGGGEDYVVYLKQRPISADWDEDGRQDLIVVRNKNTVGRISTQLRSYQSGVIDVLSWQGKEEDLLWSTGTVSGYFSDYIYEDITNDGVPELMAIQVDKKSAVMGLLTKSTSTLHVWGQE
jgi:TolB-like protein